MNRYTVHHYTQIRIKTPEVQALSISDAIDKTSQELRIDDYVTKGAADAESLSDYLVEVSDTDGNELGVYWLCSDKVTPIDRAEEKLISILTAHAMKGEKEAIEAREAAAYANLTLPELPQALPHLDL